MVKVAKILIQKLLIFKNFITILIYRLNGINIGENSNISILSKLVRRGGEISIGKNVTIHNHVLIDAQGGWIIIEDNVSINTQSVLYGGGGLKIGCNTMLAVGVRIIAQNHNFSSKKEIIKKQGSNYKGISIGDDVWLGANVIVLDGIIINNGSICGAGSIITKNTDEYSVNVGNPSKKIGTRKY
jgi:acetyltransferase-like isoleucine patch superfamily enzyme